MRCDRQRLVSIAYRRGFCHLAHLFSPPHRLPVCSISHLQRVSCPASGRLPPSRRYPRSQRRFRFRPISITPVLSRSLERFVVREYFYPELGLLQPCPSFDISDQFVFRPSGSTTAAIVAMLLYTVRSMLIDNDFVHVFSFDFSKAFDTVRHATLTSKLTQLELPGASTTGRWTFSRIMR